MRDLPESLDLLELGRRLLLDDILPLLPEARQRDLHLVATTMAIVGREAAAEKPANEIGAMLAQFYDAPHPDPLSACGEREPAPPAWEGEEQNDPLELLRRLAIDLRKGDFETSQSRERAARAILWRLTILKLREGNPQFLAANGIG